MICTRDFVLRFPTLLVLGLTGLTSEGRAQSDSPLPTATASTSSVGATDELEKLNGSLVLAAPGELSGSVKSAFVQLAGGGIGRVVTVSSSRLATPSIDWKSEGCASQSLVRIDSVADIARPAILQELLEASGIWLGELPDEILNAPLLRALLVGAMKRGGVIGAAGTAALPLTEPSEQATGSRGPGLRLVPRLHLVFGSANPAKSDAHHRVGAKHPGRIVAALPNRAAIVIHSGRRVALLGTGKIGLAVYREGGVLASEQVLPCLGDRDLGDRLDYGFDLLSWIRRARASERPVYPPAKTTEPRIRNGALIVQGGSGVTDETWDRFIELAGGADAQFVCIPSASTQDDDGPSSYSARELEERGCSSVRIVHPATRLHSQRDRHLIATIEEADGIWIDGGRTYRFMDHFGESEAATAIRRVIDRGGVVGGSSAGCQVVGDFLVRGNPRTNKVLTDPGYLQGLGLLQGVILDAHFRQRDRGEAFGRLISKHPQMLGIGVDEKTALVIRGGVGEVLGDFAVSFYDASKPGRAVVLEQGQAYDLVKRRRTR